jgi:hypothetical protein
LLFCVEQRALRAACGGGAADDDAHTAQHNTTHNNTHNNNTNTQQPPKNKKLKPPPGQCSATCEPIKPELMTITGGAAVVDDDAALLSPTKGGAAANDGRLYKGGSGGAPNKPAKAATPANKNNNAAKPNKPHSGCAFGVKPVKCAYDPCIATTCLAGTVCEARYCGGCSAVCVAPPKKTGSAAVPVEKPSPAPLGRKGGGGVMCLVDPCTVTLCGAKKTCVADYRKGCDARCV